MYKAVLFIALIFSFSSHAANTHIKVGIDLWPGYYPIVLAKKLGYFEKRSLNVDFVLPEATDNMLGKFTSGELDLVCVAMGDAFSLYQQDPGLRVVMITDESAGGDALLSNHSSQNYNGKIIGTNLKGFGELFINSFMLKHGLKADSVSVVQLDAAEAVHALQSGQVDIAHTWEPYVTEIESFNLGKVIFDSSETPGLIPDALLANGQFIRNNPKALKKFVDAWLEASEWWQANLKKGNRIIESEMVMMPNSVNLEGIRLYNRKDNLIAFQQGSNMKSLYFVTQKYIDYFISKGVIHKNFDPTDILDPSFIQ